MYADLVCKGGGIKGVALVGAIVCLEEYGYEFKNLAGTSAGAIVASLLAVGYTGKEIYDIMLYLDYTALSDKNKIQSIPVFGNILSLIFNKGLHSGDYMENFLSQKFQEKGKRTFGDLMENNKSKLKVIATDVTKHTLIILPDDLIKYNINPFDFEIAKAVRMSLSIPIYYNPVILNKNNNPSYVVDGGLLSNFPVWIFDVDGVPRYPTIGLNLYDDVESTKSKCNNFISYLSDIVETSLYTAEDIYFKEKDSVRIINIPSLGLDAVDFNLPKDKMIELYDSGYSSTKKFLSNWSFENYVKKYRL